MFDLGIQDFIGVFTVPLILFVPRRLPEPKRSAGKGLVGLTVQTVKGQLDSQLARTPNPREIDHPCRSEGLRGTSLAQLDMIVSKNRSQR